MELPGNKEINVVIADDHTLVREGISLLLARSPHIRLQGEAEDGKSAVEQVRDTAPDIIIMDISMPKLNGIDAIGMIEMSVCQKRPDDPHPIFLGNSDNTWNIPSRIDNKTFALLLAAHQINKILHRAGSNLL